MTYYDPNCDLNAKEWLNLKESERYRVVETFHTRHRIKHSRDHAFLHVYVENMLAPGNGHFARALNKLQQEGLTRHEALHAISSVVEDYYRELRESPSRTEQEAAQRHLNLNVAKLSVAAQRQRDA